MQLLNKELNIVKKSLEREVIQGGIIIALKNALRSSKNKKNPRSTPNIGGYY